MFSWMSLSHAITIFNWIYATPFQKHSAQQKCVCFVFVEYKQGLGFVSIDRIRDATMILIYTFM